MGTYRTRDPITLRQLLARMRLSGWTDDHPRHDDIVMATDRDGKYPVSLRQFTGDDMRARVMILDRRTPDDEPFAFPLMPLVRIVRVEGDSFG